jgi:hypothetical protein
MDMFDTYRVHTGTHIKTTIERKDNNGPYSKDNCRWATPREQGNNRRTNRLIAYRGETRTISDWARLLQIRHDTIRHRLERGWSFERSVETPIEKYKPRRTHAIVDARP